MAKAGKAILAAALGCTAIIGVGGLQLIKDSEGKRNATYRDAVGIPTICYGHTGPEVRMGQRKSNAACDALLMKDIAKHKRGVERCTRVPLTSTEMDAVVSFTFNVGVGAYCRSTMARRINAGDKAGAARQFNRWVYAGKRKLRGLVIRRKKERCIFEAPSQQAALKCL